MLQKVGYKQCYFRLVLQGHIKLANFKHRVILSEMAGNMNILSVVEELHR